VIFFSTRAGGQNPVPLADPFGRSPHQDRTPPNVPMSLRQQAVDQTSDADDLGADASKCKLNLGRAAPLASRFQILEQLKVD
jgi:hypothetical protein